MEEFFMCGKGCGFWCWIAKLLLIIGGLNWGLIGVFNYNLVSSWFGDWPIVVRIIYIVVGLAALLAILCLFRSHKCRPATPSE
jgi:uncharacterized membrane protein YuzA (DUF378 family)